MKHHRPIAQDKAAALYAELVSHGVLLEADGDMLTIRTVDGVVTVALRLRVERMRVALIKHIKGLERVRNPQLNAEDL